LYGYALYAGYLVLGYYLHTSTVKINRQRLVAAIIFFITVVIACVATYFISKSNGKQTLTIMGSFTLNSFTQTIAIYYLLKDYEVKNKIANHIINLLSNYSFGIYLVHIMVISLFFRIGIFWTMAYPIISVPLVVLLTLLTSTIVIFLLRKIPFMARFAG
jgi:surface polysaccharide O-acyltransferase-like enzyme